MKGSSRSIASRTLTSTKSKPPEAEDYDTLPDSEIQELLFSAIQAKKKKKKKDTTTKMSSTTTVAPPKDPTPPPKQDPKHPTRSGSSTSPPKKTSTSSIDSSLVVPTDQSIRRHEVYFSDNFSSLKDSDLASLFSKIDTIAPVDWCDSFMTPFHVSLTRDPTLWIQLSESFTQVSSPEDLNIWLSSKIKTHSLAFLGSTRNGRPFVFHNLFCPSDCGTFANPNLTFYALDRSSFDASPFQLDNDDLSSLLQECIHPGAPSFAKIIEECVEEEHNPTGTDDSLPCFSLSPSKFKNLQSVPSDKMKSEDILVCSNLCLIPPCFAGMIVRYCNPSKISPNLSFEDLASNLYKLTFQEWLNSTSSLSDDEKSKGMPISFPYLALLESTFRFLWTMADRDSFDTSSVVIPSLPRDPEDASICLMDHRHQIFPELSVSSTNKSQFPQDPSPTTSSPTSPTDSQPSPPVDCSSSSNRPVPNGVRMIDDDGLEHFVSPEMFLISKCLKEVGSKKSTNEDDITTPESKSMFRDMPQTAQKQLRLAVVNRSFTSLPTDLSDVIRKVWKHKNSATFFESFASEVFDPTDNACTILLGQCAVIQRLGLRWKSEASPGGFSPFSFDPYAIPGIDSSHTLDKNIRQQIHDASLCHLNDMKQSKDMQLLYTNHSLFFPRTEDEFELRSYWSCAKGLCGDSSFICNQILKLLNFAFRHRTLIVTKMQSSANEFFFGQILFGLDEAIQEFVLSLSVATSIEDIGFDDLKQRINWLIFCIKTGSPLGSLPAALQAKFNAQQHQRQKRSGTSDENSNSNKKANQEPKIPKGAATFDSPSNWLLPRNKSYSSCFPASALTNIPSIEKNDKIIPFCKILFTKGFCKKGSKCGFCHDDPRKHNKKAAMDDFYRSVYEQS